LHNLMEDAATAEISRAQVWQWLKHGARLKDGRPIDRALCEKMIAADLAQQRTALGDAFGRSKFEDAAQLFAELVFAEEFPEFLTLPAYERVTA
jgi:malate synthase